MIKPGAAVHVQAWTTMQVCDGWLTCAVTQLLTGRTQQQAHAPRHQRPTEVLQNDELALDAPKQTQLDQVPLYKTQCLTACPLL